MKNIKNIVVPLLILTVILVASGYAKSDTDSENKENLQTIENKEVQTINMFVTHGHCSTPFAGAVHNLQLNLYAGSELKNPIEDMDLSFEVDPATFTVCRSEELTKSIRKPELFVGEQHEKIIFTSTKVYTMGLDWYQVNGTMSIKGIEKEVKFFVTGIRDSKEIMGSSLVLSGQVNLFDWGIDYDKIVNGKSDPVPTKWLYLNMRIDTEKYQSSFVTANMK